MSQKPFPPPRRSIPTRPLPTRRRTGEVVIISLLLILLLLLGTSALLWAFQGRTFFAATPTPTGTPAAAPTNTLDVRATSMMEDMLTQVAYSVALETRIAGGTTSPGSETISTPQTAILQATDLTLPGDLSQTTGVSINLPVIEHSGGIIPIESQPLATPVGAVSVSLPIVSSDGQPTSPIATPGIDSPLPTPLPVTVVATTPISEPATATATATLLPPTLPSPLAPTATNTPPPTIGVNNQSGVTVATARLYQGPSIKYTPVGDLPANQPVTLLARDSTGDWLFLCCFNGGSYWGRQLQIRARNNPLPLGAPTGSADDVRWLPINAGPSIQSITPTPLPTAIPADDYPMSQHDRANTNRVTRLPNPPFELVRLPGAQAANAFSSLAVAGPNLYAVSQDGNLYSIDKNVGNQRWRYPGIDIMRSAPLVVGSTIYLATQNGTIVALNDLGTSAQELWRRPLAVPLLSGAKLAGEKLYIGARTTPSDTVQLIDRTNPLTTKTVAVGGALQPPTVGGNLLFVASNQLTALELDETNIEFWRRSDIINALTAPAFGSPGVKALAELYVVDGTGRLWALDANTSANLWPNPVGGVENATHLALTDSAVIVSGNAYVRAYARIDSRLLWNIALDSGVPGGPITDGNRVLVVTSTGAVSYIEMSNGAVTAIQQRPPVAPGGAPAVSGNLIFIPGIDGNLYVLRGN